MKSIYFIFLKFFLCLSMLFSAIAQAGAISITYYHNDVTGSPVAATNEAGAVVWRKDYTPYGETNGKDRDNKVGYTGHQEDASGLVYAGARYYDPALGRFLGVDSVGFSESNPMSFNRYAYANNNPYKYVDPDGRFALLLAVPYLVETTMVGLTACALTNCVNKIANIINNHAAADASAGDGATDGSSGETPKRREKDVPDRAEPNEIKEGKNRTREYDSEGKPKRDYDKPHQGHEKPHVHEWDNGTREHPGRDYSPLPSQGD